EAARQLGLPVGTVSGRLTTAIRMLAKRMRRHGLTLSVGALTAALSPKAASARVPAALLRSTLKAVPLLGAGQASVAGAVSAEVAALTNGALKSLLLAKLKTATAVLLTLTALAGGTAVFAFRSTHPAEREDARHEERPRAAVPPKEDGKPD